MIIGSVLVIAVLAGIWLYSSSSSSAVPGGANNMSAANSAKTAPANAPPGAPIGVNMMGSPTATVTVEEFADYQCGSCAAAHPIMKEIKSVYGSRIQFIYRHFPLQMHDKAYDASIITEAAGLQGATKFWQMQDQLFSTQHLWTNNPNYREMWMGYAEKIGLDMEKLKADVNSMQARSRVDADLQRGHGMGVTSTPTIYLNGRAVPYHMVNVQSMRQLIDAELQATAKPAETPSAPPAASSGAAAPSAANTTEQK